MAPPVDVPRLRPVGDRAFLAQWPQDVDPRTAAHVRAVAARAAAHEGVAEAVPGFCTLVVVLRADTDRPSIIQTLRALLAAPAPDLPPGKHVTIPVAYGGSVAADLPDVARRTGLTEAQVAAVHSGADYLVYMLGFAPGFPYLGVLPEPLRLPRRASPRARVPAGAVAIADRLTGVYPQETPGGWHLIGWTPFRLFDPSAPQPAALLPGDRVRFAATPDLGPTVPAPIAEPVPIPHRPVLRVREAGLAATIQDGGRRGFRQLGVPWSGPMDPLRHALANRRAGNPPHAAAVEMTWPAPVLEALEDLICAVAGPGWQPLVDGRPVDAEAPIPLRRGMVLAIGARPRALWGYLAVAGGLDVPAVLGSRATYARGGLGGLGGRPLRAEDLLGVGVAGGAPERVPDDDGREADPVEVRVILGPQDDRFPPESLERLLTAGYAVTTRVDRTGYRLEGPPLAHREAPEILPEGVVPGAVQVPGDGQPIVVMADGPTTGGYAKIATVVTADLPRLAQAGPGRTVRFRAVTAADLDV